MCCRYYMEMSPELRPYVEAAKHSPLTDKMIEKLGKPLVTEGEVFPMNIVPVIAPGSNYQKAVFPMLWGFELKGLDRPVINARVETAAQKPSFKDAWHSHRCIIPASWYYEWEHIPLTNGKTKTGDKYAIQPRGQSITYLAGLYRIQEYRNLKYPAYTILTREPGDAISRIHDRMPLVLPESAIFDWINPLNKAEDIIGLAITDMIAVKEA